MTYLTDDEGSVTKTYEYDAFGNEENPVSADTNPFRYAGMGFEDTILYAAGGVAQVAQKDPVGISQLHILMIQEIIMQ